MDYLILKQNLNNVRMDIDKNRIFGMWLSRNFNIISAGFLGRRYNKLSIRMQTRFRKATMKRFKYFKNLDDLGVTDALREMIDDASNGIIVNVNDDGQYFDRHAGVDTTA